MAKVLIVEDDSVIADAMARHLAAAGFDPVVVGKGDQGLARLRFEQPDVCAGEDTEDRSGEVANGRSDWRRRR